jgi:hypothetical protein
MKTYVEFAVASSEPFSFIRQSKVSGQLLATSY